MQKRIAQEPGRSCHSVFRIPVGITERITPGPKRHREETLWEVRNGTKQNDQRERRYRQLKETKGGEMGSKTS